MTKNVKNVSDSTRAKLSNIAKQEGRNFDSLLMLYVQERLLYRLSQSKYCDNFILKGGLLLFSINRFIGRPTRDIDFLVENINNDMGNIKKILLEICKMEYNDGISFEEKSIIVERIKEDAEYEGVRVKITGYLGNAKKQLQLDIGFGDVVIPKPIIMTYPSLLEMEPPQIKVYSIESVIAEKFEAMITLAELNSRMKDFYDIYNLANTYQFDASVLQEAVYETFQRRSTIIEKEHIIFTEEFSKEIQRNIRWNEFLKKIGNEHIDFKEVTKVIIKFLLPIYTSIIYEKEFFGYWDNANTTWERVRVDLIELSNFENKSGEFIISDPCYKLGDKGQIRLENVETGIWDGYVEKIEHKLFGNRVAILFCINRKFIKSSNEFEKFNWQMHDSKIYVDSGQAGIFEAIHYQDESIIDVEPIFECNHSKWYRTCCDKTMSDIRAGILPYGIVSSSGLGDGNYSVSFVRNSLGKIVAIKIDFVDDNKLEDDPNYKYFIKLFEKYRYNSSLIEMLFSRIKMIFNKSKL